MNNSIDYNRVNFISFDAEQAGQRLDNYLIKTLKGVPKAMIYKIIRKGEVRVNKKRCKQDYRLCNGDVLRLPPIRVADQAAPVRVSDAFLEQLETAVLFEDEKMLIINKPSGLAVHGGSGINTGLIEACRQMRPHARCIELVHRLDKATSGCIILAKKRSFLREIHELIRSNDVEKTYTTLVNGKWPRYLREVDAPLLKSVDGSGERIVRVNPQGKPALTYFRVKDRLPEHTLLNVDLQTGRTHQIRVHTAHSGHPIVGDKKYGNKNLDKSLEKTGFNRLYLHASQLRFQLPSSGEIITVEAPLPAAFEQCLKHLRGG